MASFVALVDPDPVRRARFVEAAELAPIPGLAARRLSTATASVGWAAAPGAPVSESGGGDGLGVLWGDALDANGRLDAKGLRQACAGPDGLPPPLDGYHAGISIGPQGRVVAVADLLGLFPVYYWTAGDVLLVASSPALFRGHPSFRADLDTAGLVGVLLFAHLVGGRTLLTGVRRLAAGHALDWRPGGPARERATWTLPPSTHFHLPFEAHVDVLDDAVTAAVARQAPPGHPVGLLLSGGLDSRLLAGLIARQGGRAACLTLGLPTDFDVVGARRVARVLRFPHAVREPPAVPGVIEARIRWEALGCGLAGSGFWEASSALRGLPDHVVTGLVLDSALGGYPIDQAYSPATRTVSFETYFDVINAWGVSLPTLGRLLRPERFGEALADVLAGVRADYDGEGGNEALKVWRYHMRHRPRFHVGSRAWPIAFSSWPVLPILDRRLLETVAGIPAASLAGRRAETELVATRFPALAALPLDRNSFDFSPLRPRLRTQLRRAVVDALGRVPGVPAFTRARPEPRRYVRLMDVNGPMWRELRREAERCRELATELFRPDVLAEALPGPDVAVRPADPIIGTSGMKLLLGVLLWLRDHRP
ncbi:MAG TPA: asparagine synthase-related protein [Methylomirabilota bacterium]|nr:asparagine synthase-related protein [Methylomirabilota bacterium]